MMSDNTPSKRQRINRIVVDDDDDDENMSNPDLERDNISVPSSEEEGEDLLENLYEDYLPIAEQDTYEKAGLVDDDDIEVNETWEERRRYQREADEEIDLRHRLRRQREDENFDEVMRDGKDDEDGEERAELDELDEEEMEDRLIDERGGGKLNLEAFDCPLREWIIKEETREEIRHRFKQFLNKYYDGIKDRERYERSKKYENSTSDIELRDDPNAPKKKKPIYPGKIVQMCANNRTSLEVRYPELGEYQSLLTIWLTDVPKMMLEIFDEVLWDCIKERFPQYDKIVKQHEVHIRIIDLPIADSLRDLRQKDLNNLIKTTGVVTKRSSVSPQLKIQYYDCPTCKNIIGPYSGAFIDEKPDICVNCEAKKGFKINQEKTEYGNYQKITLQESPGTVPAGRVPRYKDVYLLGDLIDTVRPGEEIEVTGIYEYSKDEVSTDRSGFPTYNTIITANHIKKKNINSILSDEDRKKILDLANSPQIKERIIKSMAPSVYGHKHVKTALAMSLFGGCAKEGGTGGAHRVRGDINILLLGDPGTAKSQILKYAEKTAPRAVYTTGKGASAVGLTAGVHKDHISKEWVLEGGALVLADQGVCIIDEFDKMNEQDRTSIHEAMEQQTISVSKAGIICSLQARCAVLAAANPIGGRYDQSYSLAENVELTDPILSRFDVLCVLQDIVDPIKDEHLANFVVNSHMRNHPEPFFSEVEYENSSTHSISNDNANNNDDDDGIEPIDQELLKKYIQYARINCRPVFHQIDTEKLVSLYADMRKQSKQSGGVPIAVRHIESCMRMAEASAKMSLRDHVNDDDVNSAIKVMLESFLQAQKISVRRQLQQSFRKYITYGEGNNQLLYHTLNGKFKDQYILNRHVGRPNDSIRIYTDDFERIARGMNIYDVAPFYKSTLFRNSYELDERNKCIICIIDSFNAHSRN